MLASSIDAPVVLHGRAAAADGKIRRVAKLTDYELETAARACRALAHREGEDALKISDPALRAPAAKRAQCAGALAERFERARKGSGS
jgi:hypothetical protein